MKLKKTLGLILSLVIIFSMLYGIYLLLSRVFLSIDELNPNVVASIIAALTAVFGLLYNHPRRSKLPPYSTLDTDR